MKVILVNGPCGAGKTTTTKALHKKLPQSVLINIDLVRSFISGYREHPSRSWKTGLNLSLALAASAMQQDRDIIVDKMIFDANAWEPFYHLAEEFNAEVQEFIGADWLIYQDLDALVNAVHHENAEIEAFDSSCFSGRYVTGDISQDYLNDLEAERSDSAKIKRNELLKDVETDDEEDDDDDAVQVAGGL